MIGNQLSPVALDQTPIWQQEINIKGINAHGAETFAGKKTSSFAIAIDFIKTKKINVDALSPTASILPIIRRSFGWPKRNRAR